MEEQEENQIPDDFYEIENVLERRLCHKTLTYEYKVHIKDYSSEEDMWLPASFFNRAIYFQSHSKFGRKRKHKIDPDAVQEFPSKSRKTSSITEKQVCTKKCQLNSKRARKTREKQGKKQGEDFPFHFTVKC